MLLFTGKGGVGKTTVAAATAAHAASLGVRTLVVSTDAAHSLADAYDIALGDEPTVIAEGLEGQQLDARIRMERSWGEVRDHLVALLGWAGAGTIEAEELAVIPGFEEVFALIDLVELAECGRYELVVVDCAPTAETLRLLSLPEVLRWYMARIFPVHRTITKLIRPIVSRAVSMPIPGDDVFNAVERLHDRLERVRKLLIDPAITSARLVVNAERIVVAEARRTSTYLSLFGYTVDAVVINRLLPEAVADPWFDRWRAIHAEQVAEIERSFEPVPCLRVELAGTEVVGIEALRALGASLHGHRSPLEHWSAGSALTVEARGDLRVLTLPLPGVTRSEVDLVQHDRDLIVTIGPYRRAIALPDSLARRSVQGARLVDDRLEVEFVDRAARAEDVR